MAVNSVISAVAMSGLQQPPARRGLKYGLIHLGSSASGAVRGNANPHVTDGPAADAVYIRLTGDPPAPGRTTIQASTPPGTEGFVALDWKDDRLVGIEILDASIRPHHDLIEQAEING